MTDASGKFDVEVDSTRIPSAIISANGIVPQVVVVVSGEGNQVGGVLPAVATSEGAVGHVIADANNASKSLLLEKMIAAGVSPKDIDPTFLDKGFSGVELSSAQAEAIGPIIKNMVNAENGFAASLFESATGESEVSISNLLADDRKEKRDAYREVMEPSLQDAYESGTAPEQVELDILLGSMEAGVQNYLADSYGVSPQQVADLTNIKAAQVLYNMGVDVNLDPEETTVRDVLRRLKGDKFRALYVAWHQAANTLATVSTLGSTSYAEEYPEAYDNFVASKEVTLATIGNLVNNSSIPSDYWQTYLDIIYGEQISLPTQEAPANDAPIASWEAAYIPYVASRPLPYFLMTFFAQFDRQAYNGDFVIPAQAIFTNRMNNDSSEYYIGGNVWAQGPDEIASRLQAYNAALNGAVHGDSNFKTIVQNKFGQENARTILKALRVLTAPVQSW